MSQMSRMVRRYQVLCHYSEEDEPICACCGECRLEFLAFDHEEGSGNDHRKKIGKSTRLFEWLYRNNFPSGYRVLCHNCNSSHGFYGYCPHKGGEQLRPQIEADRAHPPGQGSRHPMAKINEDDVRMIRARRAEGATYKQLMGEFGTCKATLSHIFTGRQWKHVV